MDMTPNVVSDSSFYIAFLSGDEISDPISLLSILNEYTFHMGPVVLGEVDTDIDLREHVFFHENPYNYSDLLVFFFEKLYDKGEGECIILAARILKDGKDLHALITDDKGAQEFIKKNVPFLYRYVRFSLRFIVCCCCEDGKLSKERVLSILSSVEDSLMIGKSPFHINRKIVSELKEEVRKCQR